MDEQIYLPNNTLDAFSTAHGGHHPGLLLDKFAPLPSLDEIEVWQRDSRKSRLQHFQKRAIDAVVKAKADADAFNISAHRRSDALKSLHARTWVGKSTGPLTLHLSRAGANENAGICLHPLYGFVYFPGSGLKGVARAYAETVWLRQKENAATGKATIKRIFGSDEKSPSGKFQTGSVIFHDAWPEGKPADLVVDILNNHHGDYYKDKGGNGPGDWENPIPVYFLAVKPNTRWSFAVSPSVTAQKDSPDADLKLAAEWLASGMEQLGIGAKTVAGYGRIIPDGDAQLIASVKAAPKPLTFEANLRLVTPAFLAGAQQDAEDCDLRPATLRGLLRWWWRTMHTGYLAPDELYELESVIWGNTEKAGLVSTSISGVTTKLSGESIKQVGYTKTNKEKLVPDFQFFDSHQIPNENGTPGLFYLAYGMDELVSETPSARHQQSQRKTRKQRLFLESGSEWRLTVTTRTSDKQYLESALDALWLLCNYGGVGSKAGKGFGSLEISDKILLPDGYRWPHSLEETGGRARSRFNLDSHSRTDSSDLSLSSEKAVLLEGETDPWRVLHCVGAAYRDAAAKRKHQEEKLALGLPRNIHGPLRTPLPHQEKSGTHKPPEPLRASHPVTRERFERFKSPIHIHVRRNAKGFDIRLLALFQPVLPSQSASEKFLRAFIDDLATGIDSLAKESSTTGSQVPQSASSPKKLFKAGDTLRCKIVSERTKRGGLRVMLLDYRQPDGTPIFATVVDKGGVLSGKNDGDVIDMVANTDNISQLAVRPPSKG